MSASPYIGFSGFGPRIRTDDADELIFQDRCGRNGAVNALREACVVPWVLSAGDDALMRLTLTMEALEIRVIMGKDSTPDSGGVRENVGIGNALAGTPGLLDRAHVMPQSA